MTQNEAILIGRELAIADFRGGYRRPCSYDTATAVCAPHVHAHRGSVVLHIAAEEYMAAFALLCSGGRIAGRV